MKIKETIRTTIEATFSVMLPGDSVHRFPKPSGTGFFIDAAGWFVTARHVITVDGSSTGKVRDDVSSMDAHAHRVYGSPPRGCNHFQLVADIPEIDIALLKSDFRKNSNRDFLKERDGFPFLTVGTRQMEIGEDVYSFGFPLSEAFTLENRHAGIHSVELSPRATSAIVSSDLEKTKMIMSDGDPKVYVLDKALNYGNSGGPIVATDTGCVHAICSRFQPLYVPQLHLAQQGRKPPAIMSPSLYGIVSSLSDHRALEMFNKYRITIVEG